MTPERIKELRALKIEIKRPHSYLDLWEISDIQSIQDTHMGLREALDAIERVQLLMREWDGDPLREWCAEAVLAALEGAT